ncbi:MAG TPA: NAD-dependent epimerase/dehydratase family protein [Candidatus Lustribacter sp.]|nr:NAD-dependent epimerase/dehydratase family protein [Candidatus Lustribacter sp.]
MAVTGATGLLGYQVCRAAAAEGYAVRAVVRGERSAALASLSGGPVEQVRADLDSPASLRAALDGVQLLIHCAARYAFGAQRAQEVHRTNDAGTRAVLEAAAEAGVRRAVVTSSSVTCGSATTPVARTERDHLRTGGLTAEPAPAYYRSKVSQERTALAVGDERNLEVVLALPTVILGGPYARLAPSNAIVLRYLLDPTRSTFPGGCNVVDVRDVAKGHVLLLSEGSPGERYLLGGTDLSWRALHTDVSDLAGRPGPGIEVSPAVAYAVSAAAEAWARLTGDRPLSTTDEAATVGRWYWYSSARAEDLGYRARPAREAVAHSLAWLLVGEDLPRWARESLRVDPAVRAARPLVPRPLDATTLRGRPPRRRRSAPRRPR